jgi:hypothetical protein
MKYSDKVNNAVNMHLCNEILSLIIPSLLSSLTTAIVIVVIVHLMIIASPALPFRARWNSATPSPPSQWQIVSFWGGRWRHDNETPCQTPSFVHVCSSFLRRPPFPMKVPRPLCQNRRTAPQRGRGRGRHRDASPPSATAAPAPAVAAAARLLLLLLLLPPSMFLSFCAATVCCIARLKDMVGRLMIDAAGCRAPSSPSGGALTGAARNLAARRAVGSPGGAAPGGGVGGGGGGAGFAAPPPLPSCRAEYAHVIAGRTPGVTVQDLRRSEAWLGNRRRLVGVMAGLSLPAHCRRPVVAVLARGSTSLGHGVAPRGARCADRLEGWMDLAPLFGWGCVCVAASTGKQGRLLAGLHRRCRRPGHHRCRRRVPGG